MCVGVCVFGLRFWTQTRWIRPRRWRRIWTCCTTAWRCTTRVTAGQRWRTTTAFSAPLNLSSSKKLPPECCSESGELGQPRDSSNGFVLHKMWSQAVNVVGRIITYCMQYIEDCVCNRACSNTSSQAIKATLTCLRAYILLLVTYGNTCFRYFWAE